MTDRLVSVIMPTLNAAPWLEGAIAQFGPAQAGGLVAETIVSDGGSADGSAALAEAAGALVLSGSAGRGRQLARGAAAARAPWLLFLHADTRLQAGWAMAVRGFIAAQGQDAAAAFRFALDDHSPAARRLERLVAWRSRVLALPYGDQGLLISRRLYDAVGGFRPLPLMEDVDLIGRIGRARLRALDIGALTSADRYRGGYKRRSLRNLACLALWFAGVPPHLIARLYG